MQDIEPGRRAMYEHEYSRRLWKWLEKFKFTEDPFAVWEADRERSVLPSLFVDRPYAAQLVGDPARPQSGFLLAGRGAGKTATRDGGPRVYRRPHPPPGVAHPVHRLHGRARPGGRRPGPGQVARSRGQPSCARDCAALADEVPPAFFALLDEDHRGLLQGVAACFADPPARTKLGRLAPAAATEMPWEQFSPVELLDTFASLVTQLGASG